MRHAWNRIKYEYRSRPKKQFLRWLYHGKKSALALNFHNTLSSLFGHKRYLRILKKWRLRKIDEEEFIEIRWADPSEIEYISPTREKLKWYSTGKVKRGNWDKNVDRFNELPIYSAMKKRMEEGKDWDEIEEVRKAREGGIKWPGKPYKVDKDIRKSEELIESINSKGYQTQEELTGKTWGEAEKDWDLKSLNEVCVDLDREGNPLFVDGRHRLSIAKIKDVEEIPVRVVMRHHKTTKKDSIEQ